MATLHETPHTTVLRLITGHFQERSGYRAVRSRGVDDWLLIYTISGRGRFGHAGGDLVAESGDWVLLKPGTPHDYGVEATLRRWELLWAHFQPRPDWASLLNWPVIHGGLMRRSMPRDPGRRAARRFAQVHALRQGGAPLAEMRAMNALEDVLLQCAAEIAGDSGHDPRVQAAMEYLVANLEQKLSLDDVAQTVGLSASRLSHIFRDTAGQTPIQYLETARLERAADLLRRTGFSIKQVAAAVGFDNQLYFSLRFHKRTGMSPTQYRERA